MLSGAKHLLFVVENKQKQIPRSARDDIVGAFFSSLLEKAVRYARLLGASVLLGILCSSWLSAQTPVVDPSSGLRLLVDSENVLPALRLALPGQPTSKAILIIFPEHVTVREHGKSEAVHLYLWQPGRQGKPLEWRRVGQSLEYEMELKGNVHMLARATLESDGVRYHYEFIHRSGVDYDMIQAISDPRLFRSIFRDVRLERTYVHRKGGFELLASDMPARLTMPLNHWLPARYLNSYTWPVPAPEKRVVKGEGITYYNASRPVDEPFIATVSEDGKWIAATWNPDTGNVWTNPELTCQHADSETSLKTGGSATLGVKTFVFKGTLEQLLARTRAD